MGTISIKKFKRFTKKEILEFLKKDDEEFIKVDTVCFNCGEPVVEETEKFRIEYQLEYYTKKSVVSMVEHGVCEVCGEIIRKMAKLISEKSLELLREQKIDKEDCKFDYSNDEPKGKVVSVKKWSEDKSVS